MKMILFASALALSGVAYAQAAPMATPDAGAATNAPPAAAAAPDSSMTPAPATPDASAPAAAPMAPATPDASAPATTATPDATAAAASTDDSNLPMCSKTVTDKCKQGSKGGHAMKHHKKK